MDEAELPRMVDSDDEREEEEEQGEKHDDNEHGDDEEDETKFYVKIKAAVQDKIRRDKEKECLKLFQTIEPEGVNVIKATGEWEVLELAVDSGATETVVNEEMVSSVEVKEGPASKRGVKYEVATGVRIPNLGEKKFQGITQEGTTRTITAQVCDVNKALLSVKKVVSAGNRVVFDEEGSYIQDKLTGEIMDLREDNGMYMLNMWVKKGPF